MSQPGNRRFHGPSLPSAIDIVGSKPTGDIKKRTTEKRTTKTKGGQTHWREQNLEMTKRGQNNRAAPSVLAVRLVQVFLWCSARLGFSGVALFEGLQCVFGFSPELGIFRFWGGGVKGRQGFCWLNSFFGASRPLLNRRGVAIHFRGRGSRVQQLKKPTRVQLD